MSHRRTSFRRSAVRGLAIGAVLLALAGCSAAETAATADDTPPTTVPAPILDDDGLGPDDGYTPIGEWLTLDDDVPAITNLDAAMRDALDRAAAEAAASGVEFSFTDAWRSEAYQQHLFDRAVLEYGSEEEARRWAKPADESQHVFGNAVDLATADAMDWLNRFGAAYGLCQIYANELWHFEYVEGVTDECPAQLPDSSAG
jgi:zinc D-Ala-D-Ala carboxypeptidase